MELNTSMNNIDANPDSTKTPSDFGKRVKLLRESAFMTVDELADSAGVSDRTIRNIENGPSWDPKSKTALKVAKALGVSVDSLWEKLEPGHPHSSSWRRKLGLGRPAVLFAGGVLTVLLGLAIYSVTHANWTVTEGRLEVRDRILGVLMWKLETGESEVICIESPWNSKVLLVGQRANNSTTGPVIAVNRVTGREEWRFELDVAWIRNIFGSSLVDRGVFGIKQFGIWYPDRDRPPLVIAHFYHNTYYPTALCAFDAQGRVHYRYAFAGAIKEFVMADLTEDGLDEIIIASTNNKKIYQGGMLTVLNAKHFAGGTVDEQAFPGSTTPDSSLYRTILPAYPDPWMRHMSSERLTASAIAVVPRGEGRRPVVTAAVGVGLFELLVVYFDSSLRPLTSHVDDSFSKALSNWPDSLTSETGPGDETWRASWLDAYHRFELGRPVR